jgi:hypothetical protein
VWKQQRQQNTNHLRAEEKMEQLGLFTPVPQNFPADLPECTPLPQNASADWLDNTPLPQNSSADWRDNTPLPQNSSADWRDNTPLPQKSSADYSREEVCVNALGRHHLTSPIVISILRSTMPPSAPSQSSPLSVSMQDGSAKSKERMAERFDAAPVSTPPPYQDPYNNSMWNNSMMGSAMNSYPGMMYGGGGMNTPFLSPMMMPNPINTTGPFSNLTNYLLGLQNVILSIGQVVQIISFNTNSLQHLCESILAMFEHAVRTWHEQLPASTGTPEASEEQQQRQRRIRTLRYAGAMALTYLGYSIVRSIRNRYLRNRHPNTRFLDYGPPVAHPPQHPPMSSYYNASSSSHPQSGMPPYQNHHSYPYSGGPTW